MAVLGALALAATGCQPGGGDDGTSGADDGSGGTDPGGTGEPVGCGADVLDPGPAPLRRLSHTQYRNTVRDLLPGVELPALTVLVDPKVNGFENNAEVQAPSELLISQYQKAAVQVTDAAMQQGIPGLPCAPDGGDDPAGCGRDFLADFGARAFRRPWTADESAAFLGFFDQRLAEHGFNVALQLTMQALLQSPPFLYFVEYGGEPLADAAVRPLTGHELAARLSYFLWDTMPDPELLGAAERGELDAPAGIEAQARRMLADARARGAVVNFHRQWFEWDRILEIVPDAAAYPNYTPELRASMREEVDRFVEHTVFEGEGTFAALLTSTETLVDAGLAALYGVPAPQDGWEVAQLDATRRAGVLTRAGWLARTAHAVHPSPVRRGVFVLSRLLCTPPAPPPANVDTNPPDASDPAQPQTNRERYAQHTAQDQCGACHRTIDGAGFTFEHYDALGQWRDLDNGHAIDARGELVGTDVDGAVDGAVALSQRLAQSEQAHGCVVAQVFRYALARGTTPADLCSLDTLTDDFLADSGDIQALLVAVVTSDAFRYRREVAP